MTKNRERGRWGLCFGVLGALVVAGAMVTAMPHRAQAQNRPAQGVAQFNRACGRCHPDGGEDTGPDLHNLNKTEEQMTTIIRNGQKRMRAIPPNKLSNADLAKVMVYLRSIHAVR